MTKTLYQILSLNILTLVIAGCSNQVEQPSKEAPAFNLVADIKVICDEVPQKYAYFEARSAHWPETCERAEKEASLLEGKQGSLAILERIVDDLYDPHIGLNTNNQESPRLVPSGSDLWIELVRNKHFVTAVRPMSGAADAGIRVGDELVRFNGMKPDELALTRIHAGKADLSANRVIWAINAAIAGRRTDPRNIEILRGDDVLALALGAPEVSLPEDPITYDTLSERVGYIRFNNSLGNSSTVSAFNTALNALRQTDGLIIDLRETAGGGNTDVAEPIMGRFIEKRTAYQRTVLRNGSTQDRKIKPSGSWTYNKPVIVLVGRWTGSMGEGIAIGFDGMGRGKVMGSKMARLAGGTEPIRLKETGVSFKLPTYDLHHLNGTPRHNWEPTELETADNGAENDILLDRALLALQSK